MKHGEISHVMFLCQFEKNKRHKKLKIVGDVALDGLFHDIYTRMFLHFTNDSILGESESQIFSTVYTANNGGSHMIPPLKRQTLGGKNMKTQASYLIVPYPGVTVGSENLAVTTCYNNKKPVKNEEVPKVKLLKIAGHMIRAYGKP